ncbi:uncharacterized protein N7496_001668 [Penicillium cataractarum]|uniref:Uncharacterized protein n=1 Tax=Penicillium cataractarum TaxID=2100454 RepID=A0A9W9VWM3_9EURO|nr:uncharacterized protein N7496_001668 [Penicillium cataractarum]KAJ5390600.1 hypothetical protein N7496_001668 [Penicillium cataractarum]
MCYNHRPDTYPRTVVRQLNTHDGKHIDELWRVEKAGKMLDLGDQQYNHLVLLFRGLVHVVKFWTISAGTRGDPDTPKLMFSRRPRQRRWA